MSVEKIHEFPPGERIVGVCTYQGNMYVATSKGIYKMEEDRGGHETFQLLELVYDMEAKINGSS